MTIYYVDPWNGSNSNDGLGWGTAWRYLPGNGSAIAAGDEIRYAKSPTRTLTQNMYGNQTYWYSNGTVPNSTSLTVAGSWVASQAYVTTHAYGLSVNASSTVPANTKLGYRALSHSSSTYTDIDLLVALSGGPAGASGQYLKVVLCSDAAGDVPVVELLAPTPAIAARISGEYYPLAVMFTHRAASALSLTIGSIAIYSVASFTVSSGGVFQIGMRGRGTYHIFFSTVARNILPKPGAALQRTTNELDSRIYLPTAPVTRSVVSYNLGYTDLRYYMAPNAIVGNSLALTPSFTEYAAWPVVSGLELEQSLTFTGTAVAPIKIRGGYNTSTGLQDGFTVFGYEIVEDMTFGAMVFTSGGDYLEFERVICQGRPLLGYPNSPASLTINSLKFTACTVGSYTHSSGVYPEGAPLIQTSTTTNTITYTSMSFTECVFSSPTCLQIKRASATVNKSYFSNAASSIVTIVNFSAIDSICGPCLSNPGVTVRLTGTMSLKGTAPYRLTLSSNDNYRDPIVFSYQYAGVLELENFLIEGWTYGSYGVVGFRPDYSVGALSYPVASIKNMSNAHYASYLFLGHFQTTTIDTVVANNATYPVAILVDHPTSGWQNTNTNCTVTVKGETKAINGSTYPVEIFIANLININLSQWQPAEGDRYTSFGTHGRPWPAATYTGWKLSQLCYGKIDDLLPPTLTTPDAYTVEIQNSVLGAVACNFPTGFLRTVGCTFLSGTRSGVFPTTTFALGTSAAYQGPTGILGFGSTIVNGLLSNMRGSSASSYMGNIQSYNYLTANSTRRFTLLSGIYNNTTITYSNVDTSEYNNSNGPLYAVLAPGYTADMLPAAYNRTHQAHLIGDNKNVVYGWAHMLTVDKGALNTYGKYDVSVSRSLFLGNIFFAGGRNTSISIVVRTTASIFSIRLTIPPCSGYRTTMDGHVFFKTFAQPNTDMPFTWNLAPANDTEVGIYIHGSATFTLKDFSVTIS